MPDPVRLLRTLRQAIQAVRDTPGRKGRLVSLQEVCEVMVVGDLHGNVENFRQVLQKAALQFPIPPAALHATTRETKPGY